MNSAAVDSLWNRLDAPAKLALRWAWALASTRTSMSDAGVEAADSLDLLTGVLLADLPASPARALFEHFDIPPGLVLDRPSAHPPNAHPPSADSLLAAIKAVPNGQLPPLDSAIRPAIDRLLSAAPTETAAEAPEPDGLISLRELFGVLLEHAGPASNAIREQLAARGADPDQVIEAYREYVGGRASYAEFLRERFPYRPPRAELATVLPDQPPARVPAAQAPPDLVGIGAEIDAFAYLIASTQLTPPLAVGLFGEWGAGKSYFIRSLQHRIDTLAGAVNAAWQRPDSSPPPFHRHIVQVEFNAWQYVGGDLWAGLLEHLFRNLRRSGIDTEGSLAERQRYWISKVRGAEAELAGAERERERLAAERDKAKAAVAECRQHRERALAERARQRGERLPAAGELTEKIRQEIDEVSAGTGIGIVAQRTDELAVELDHARDALRGAGAVLAPLRTGGWRYLVLRVLPLLLVPPAVAFGLQMLDSVESLTAVATTVASALAMVIGYLRGAARFVAGATEKLAKVRQTLAEEENQQRKQLDDQVAEATERLDQAEHALATAEAAERDITTKVRQLTAELAGTTRGRMLSEFINDRINSDDYRSQLGVPALVRRDLERLSDLVADRSRDPAGRPGSGRADAASDSSDAPAASDAHAIDRIVLYIDDLDRCPTPLVIKVLEAVHLLLAFPLFVVVVAVDSRWLVSSLREHYSQLGGQDASPEDYLEKIFQVPFLVRPLGRQVRQRMLRGLLAPSLVTLVPPTRTTEPPGAGPDTEAGAGVGEVPPTDLTQFRDMVERLAATDRRDPAWLAATKLTITAEELRAIEQAADLVGDTPRAVKRYANIYLLAKSMGQRRGWTLPPGGQLAVLLAIATGLRTLAADLLPHLAAASFDKLAASSDNPGGNDQPRTLSDMVRAKASGPDALPILAVEYETLRRWLATHRDHDQFDLPISTGWIELIARFRFTGPAPTSHLAS